MQLELRQQYNILTAEKAEIQKMIYKLTNHWKVTDTLEANITMHEADVRKLTEQVKDQSIDLEKSQIRNHNQKNQINILKMEMQGKEKEIYTAEIKLSKLNRQLKEQQEEIGNKEKVIQALKAEIESYEVGVNNTKTMTMGQLNIENKILKSTGRKIITITNNTIVSISFTRVMITITIVLGTLEFPFQM